VPITARVLAQLIIAINVVVIGCGIAVPGNVNDPEHGLAVPAIRGDSAEHDCMGILGIRCWG
jgi:hypothetical protein